MVLGTYEALNKQLLLLLLFLLMCWYCIVISSLFVMSSDPSLLQNGI